jgi:hypothetical protein
MALREADQHLRQRTNLHGLPVEARRFDPGVFLLPVPFGELRLRFSGPGMQGLAALIISMGNIFADGIAKHFVRCGLERMCPGDISLRRNLCGVR